MRRAALQAIWLWGPLALYVCIIFYLSSQAHFGWLSGYPDYFTHPVEYFGLSILVARALNQGLSRPLPGQRLFWAFLMCVAIGSVDEWWQRYTPDRLSDWMDVVKDAIGAGAGLLLVRLAAPFLARGGQA